jgi:Asp-tRNA(Asn)/Glu-tRNA(Gln) amidotransferase C subunit
MDLLFHKLSDKEKEEIKKQVDSILKSFSEKLSKIKGNEGESFIERMNYEREENGKPEEISRKIMFENAPEKNEDAIIGEKGKW